MSEKIKTINKIFTDHLILILLISIYIFLYMAIANLYLKEVYFSFRWAYNLIIKMAFSFYLSIFSLFFIIMVLKNRNTNREVMIEIQRRYLNIECLGGGLVSIFLLPLFMNTFSNFKQIIPKINNFTWDELFMKIDFLLHFNYHPWVLLHPFFGKPNLTWLIDRLYIVWFPLLFSMIFWMAISNRRRIRIRFFLSFILLWIFLGTILATIFSSAGPCYFDQINQGGNPYEKLMSYLQEVNQTSPLLALFNQHYLWDYYSKGLFCPFGGISAMPSMHVAAAVLFAIVGWNVNKLLGILLWGYVLIVQIGSVYLGWHYAIDGYVGGFLVYPIWKGSDYILEKFNSYFEI